MAVPFEVEVDAALPNIIDTPNCICQLKPCTISFNLFRYVPENNGRGISPNDPLFLGTYLSTF